jgi:hypothetical protein
VTPRLLKKLELLVCANVPRSLGSHTPFRSSLVEIRLTDSRADSRGSEILTAIDDYEREYFPDTIRRAEIGLRSFLADDFSIQFDRERTFTVLKVSKHSPTARADAIRVADQVMQIVGDHKNGNWFLNPPSLLKALFEIFFACQLASGYGSQAGQYGFPLASLLLGLGSLFTITYTG